MAHVATVTALVILIKTYSGSKQCGLVEDYLGIINTQPDAEDEKELLVDDKVLLMEAAIRFICTDKDINIVTCHYCKMKTCDFIRENNKIVCYECEYIIEM